MNDSDNIGRLLAMPRLAKQAIAFVVDVTAAALSVVIAFYLRVGEPPAIDMALVGTIVTAILLSTPIFIAFGMYRAIFRFAGWASVVAIARAVLLYGVFFAGVYTLIGLPGVPRTVGLIQPIVMLLLLGASRGTVRFYFDRRADRTQLHSKTPNVLIYGAGAAGRQLANAIRTTGEMRVAGFLDDNPALHRATIDNIRVLPPADLTKVVTRKQISDVLLAIPSATRARRSAIVQEMRGRNLHVRTLPGLIDLARGNVSVSDLRELEIEDLLGRPPVAPDNALLGASLSGRVVLVTGAGGSIGSELCRQILRLRPARLLLAELSEFALYTIHQELLGVVESEGGDPEQLVPLLASVVDARRMNEIIGHWRPDIIYHAAAYKHVPLVEHNVVEGVRNNAIGTYTVARLAREHRVPRFVLISTDKAVRPTNIMGASKRFAEMTLQAMQYEGGPTCFSMVRFGNVLGSSGSVVPLFRHQIAQGGPLTITHPEITRYFMLIPEAAQLVLHAGALATGGDVFVLDMGEPVKIVDLARNIVELSGLAVRDAANPDGDVEIRVVGLRPGEKLFEELLIGNDPQPTSHPRIMRAREDFLAWPRLGALFDEMLAALEEGDAPRVQALLKTIVNDYRPNSPLVDHVALQTAAATSCAA